MKKRVLLAYIPVIHRGYVELLRKYADVDTVYIFGKELIGLFDHLYRKDLRALSSAEVVAVLRMWHTASPIQTATLRTLTDLSDGSSRVIMPDESESRWLAEQYLGGCEVVFEPVFLRRDKRSTTKKREITPGETISATDLSRRLLARAYAEAAKSSDWWRRIGALVVRDGEIILVGHNHHVPSPHTPYAYGDPRSNFTKGVKFELSTALHAEAAVVSEAARCGLSLAGTSLYVTTFPCPPCAKLVAYAGFAQLYFHEGYAVLDGESILRSQDVDIIRIV